MPGEACVRLYTPSSMYVLNSWYAIAFLRRLWNEHRAEIDKFNDRNKFIEDAECKITTWYKLMVITYVLKEKGFWDDKLMQPKLGPVHTRYPLMTT